MPGQGVPGGGGQRPGVSDKWLRNQLQDYSGGPDSKGHNANWSLNEHQMKVLANQMQEQGLGRKGINWLLDNKGYQGALGGGIDMKSDYAFNKNLTPEMVRWMQQQPGFSGGLNDSSNRLQGDLFQQFPELTGAYLGGMGKGIGYDNSVVNIGPDGRPYSSGGGYGFYQGQGGQSSKDQWIAAQQDAYARRAAAYPGGSGAPAQGGGPGSPSVMPPGGGVPNQPSLGGGYGTGGGRGPGGITAPYGAGPPGTGGTSIQSGGFNYGPNKGAGQRPGSLMDLAGGNQGGGANFGQGQQGTGQGGSNQGPQNFLPSSPQSEAARRLADDQLAATLAQLGVQKEQIGPMVEMMKARFNTDEGYATKSLNENTGDRGIYDSGIRPQLQTRDIGVPFGRQRQDLANQASQLYSQNAADTGQAYLDYDQQAMEILLQLANQQATEQPLELPQQGARSGSRKKRRKRRKGGKK